MRKVTISCKMYTIKWILRAILGVNIFPIKLNVFLWFPVLKNDWKLFHRFFSFIIKEIKCIQFSTIQINCLRCCHKCIQIIWQKSLFLFCTKKISCKCIYLSFYDGRIVNCVLLICIYAFDCERKWMKMDACTFILWPIKMHKSGYGLMEVRNTLTTWCSLLRRFSFFTTLFHPVATTHL